MRIQNISKTDSRKIVIGLVAYAGFWLALTQTASAQQTIFWNKPAGGFFHDFPNWNPATVPGVNDIAVFGLNNNYNVNFAVNTTNNRMLVNGGNVTFNLASPFGFPATYTLTNTGLFTTPSILVGTISDSTLNVTGGTLAGVTASLGVYAGVRGSVNVLGADAQLNLTSGGHGLLVGDVGNGTLSVSGGGRVNSDAGSIIAYSGGTTGSATVTGAGSRWTNFGSLSVGDFGNGTLRIEDRGQVSNRNGYIAWESGSTGSATVTGPGSTWTNSSDLRVGVLGNGTLRIEDGGRVVSNTNGGIALGSGSTGLVTVTGAGSKWTNSLDLTVGLFGNSALRIEDRGQVSNSSGYIAWESGSTGSATVTGVGSTWTNADFLVVGELGNATLRIEDGGRVSNREGYIGDAFGSISSATVTGAGSSWTNSGELVVGEDGNGTLRIEDGGRVSNTAGIIAKLSASIGSAIVTGAGSTWTNTGELAVGRLGFGTLRIEDGGTVIATGGTNLYSTGTLELQNATTFTGQLRSLGGSIRTIGDTTLANQVDLNSAGVIVVTITPETNTIFSGNITGAGGLRKNSEAGGILGQGTLVLNGTNTYSGQTRVNAGTLLVNGSIISRVFVNAGTLGGNGTIFSSITIGNNVGNGDSFLAPGTSIGTLTMGSLELGSDAVLAFELDSSNSTADLIDVNGTVFLNSNSLFSFIDLGAGSLADGLSFTVINNDNLDSIAGQFANISEGFEFTSGFNTFRASYVGGTGNDFTLTTVSSVPEPGSLLCLTSIALVGLTVRRKRRA